MFAHLGIRALGLVLLATILVDQKADASVANLIDFDIYIDKITDNEVKEGENCNVAHDKKYKELKAWRSTIPENSTDPEIDPKTREAQTVSGKVCPLTPNLTCNAASSVCTAPAPNSTDSCIQKFERNDDVGPDCWEKAQASFPASGPILTLSSLSFGIALVLTFVTLFSAKNL